MNRLLIVATAGLALTSCAPSGISPLDSASVADPDRQCFLPQTVRNFRSDGDTTTYVRAGRNEVFELNSGFCRGLNAAQSMAISGGRGTGGRSCVGETVDIAVAGPSLGNENNSRCRAQVTRKLTEDEAAALPSRMRP